MKALVVVDYQNDFVDGPLGGADAVSIEGPICSRIEDCLGEGWDVFLTMDTHGPDYMDTREGRMLPVRHCIKGTDGWELHGRVRELSRREELCGVATNICVLANAVLARTANPEADVVVRRDCVASYDRRLGEEALDVMASLQVEVI